MKQMKKFFQASIVLIMIIALLTVVIGVSILKFNKIFFGLLLSIFIVFILTIVFMLLITSYIIKDRKINKNLLKIDFSMIRFIFPMLLSIAPILRIEKNDLRRIFIIVNNKYVYSNTYRMDSKDIIILIPHCIQNNTCGLKITTDINNCKKCGKCKIKDLLVLKEKYNIKIFVATGGTLARKIILDCRPKAVIAVACERDLMSGVQDVRKIPVLAVFNKRPFGPCFNTTLDINEVEDAIKFFTK
ncbi:MAG: DUF116 domain-containing protein [Clostridioides sp.]|jgi:hypothetical protein|nr:DUF116 domain-containing protein [Clostridioides sp.]